MGPHAPTHTPVHRRHLFRRLLFPHRLPDARSVSLREIDWIARNEDVVRLEDIVLRRLNLGVAGLFTARDIEAIAIVAASRVAVASAVARWARFRR